ncbi:MAG: hypothetical protein ACFFEJ_16980 [Candidatus Thorarchaeota archaeon]
MTLIGTTNPSVKSSSRGLKSKRTMFFTIYILLVVFIGLINWGILFPPPQRELIGTTSVQSWVPTYILYDPPGELSYGRCYSYDTITIRLAGGDDDIMVDTEFTAYLGFGSFSTRLFGLGHSINAPLLNQTWQLWKYTDGTREWLQAELINISNIGSGIFGFDSSSYVNSRGMWVEDKTGEESSHSLEWFVAAGELEEITIVCTQREFVLLGGYLLHIFGYDIVLNISISITSPVTNTYVLNNNMTSLSARLYSSGPIEQTDDGSYTTEGAFVWFDQ